MILIYFIEFVPGRVRMGCFFGEGRSREEELGEVRFLFGPVLRNRRRILQRISIQSQCELNNSTILKKIKKEKKISSIIMSF